MVRAPADLLLVLLNASVECWLFTRQPRDLLLSCFLNLGLDVIELSSSATEAQDLVRAPADLLLLLLNASVEGWLFTRPPRDLLLSCFLDLGLDILELSLSATEAQDMARAPAGLLLLFRMTLPSSRPTRDLLLSCFLNLGLDVIELSPSATEAEELVRAPADLLLLLLNASVEGWLFTRPPRDLLLSCFLDLGLEVLEILSSSTEAQDLVRALAGLLLLFRTALPSSRPTRDLLLSCFPDLGLAILEFASLVAMEHFIPRKALVEGWLFSLSQRYLLLPCSLGLDEFCNRRLGIVLKTSKVRALLVCWCRGVSKQITLVEDAGNQEEV